MRALRVVAVVLVLTLAGCGLVPAPDDGGRATTSRAPSSTDVVTKSLRDVERYWGGEFPKIAGGRKFQPVRGGFHPYTESKPPPDCGGQSAGYQPNAFYCPDGDYIAWDAQNLIPQLQEDFGPLLVGVVMAHEYGHAVQARLGDTDQPTVVLEQQADCFAGAWLADVQAGHSAAFKKPAAEQLDDTVAGILMLRDQPGTPAVADGAHGNAFDRIRAFQEGIQQGPKRCAGYDADNLQVTEVPFSSRAEAESGGDLPYDDAVNLLAQDAEQYWERTFPEIADDRQWQPVKVETFEAGNPPDCDKPDSSAGGAAFYCASGDFIAFDGSELGPTLYDRIGDFAVGMLLGDLFARAAQDRRGASTADKAGQLTVDCLAGSWTNDLLTRDESPNDLHLSPGDLDEAVAALLAFGRAGKGGGPSAFDRISAYRKGVLEGLGVCV
ncbi:neutral zinc metallopeptidase [Paractinoplanes globisporus]|uniref:Neutral zinc metallopeptidase n=1 Tax=Paractinoplanes globisporus TaxID=113565 RepID=A0ABW6WTR3_9ACTN|nr:neutral zinc metallopeptidase [Actinoplanes globisporus]